jgi:hypothetical protein
MSSDPLARSALVFARSNELLLTPEGEERLNDRLSVRDYFALLMGEDCLADARRVLAHAMPKRRALWWGLLCAWEVYRPSVPENVEAVLRAVAEFIQLPSEANRRTVEALAELVRPQSPAHVLAMAVFLSGGSMIKAGAPEVLPKPFLTGRLVGVSVYLAAVAREPLKYRQRLAEYLALGLEIARGNNLWSAPTITPEGAMASREDLVLSDA